MKEVFTDQLTQMGVDQLVAAYQTADSIDRIPEVTSLKSQILARMQDYIYENCGEGINRFTVATSQSFRSYGEHACESL